MVQSTLFLAVRFQGDECSLIADHSSNLQEVMEGLHRMIERILHSDVEAQAKAAVPILQARRDLCIPASKLAAQRMPAHAWWAKYGAGCPELQKMAVRVLSQVCALQTCNTRERHILRASPNESLVTEFMPSTCLPECAFASSGYIES